MVLILGQFECQGVDDIYNFVRNPKMVNLPKSMKVVAVLPPQFWEATPGHLVSQTFGFSSAPEFFSDCLTCGAAAFRHLHVLDLRRAIVAFIPRHTCMQRVRLISR
jgi:hypothetical protein